MLIRKLSKYRFNIYVKCTDFKERISLDNKGEQLEEISMFERAVMVSAVLAFTSFCVASSSFCRLIGLKAQSPITVIQQILPSI